MDTNSVRLTSTVICDDVLVNAADRITMYGIFRDLAASGFPAEIVRLHVVTTWFNDSAQAANVIQRVVVLSPEGDLVSDQAVTIDVSAGAYHTQITRFLDTVFPVPGTYRVQVQAGTEIVADLPLFSMTPTNEIAKEEA